MSTQSQEQQEATLLLRRKIHLLLRAGKLLIESQADTNRIERNMIRIAAYLGIPEDVLHISISWNMLIVNVSDESHSVSKFQRCEKHSVNMTAISAISRLSWRAIDEDYSIEKFESELDRITSMPRNYSNIVVAIGASIACGGFCKLFGCDWIAFVFAAICAFIGFRVRHRCLEFGMNVYISMAFASLVATCFAYLSTFSGLSSTPVHPLLACSVFMVPGVPLINFVDDMVDNHLLVGLTRLANCLMMIGGMTLGITLAIGILGFNDITIGKTFGELSIVAHDSYIVYAIAAAIAAMGFSMIFNIPRRLLWVVAIGGALSVCTRNFLNLELGSGPIIGSFAGAALVSLIGIKAVHWFHTPAHVITIPSVIPMIPGVLMYRSVLEFAKISNGTGDITAAFTNASNAIFIVLAISVGVAIPNITARRYIASDRRRQLEQMLEDRRKRGIFFE